jgi:nitric oxide reductase subunit B
LPLAILWISTAWVAGGLFLASSLGEREPKGQATWINILFAALALVIFGSLFGEMFGIRQPMGRAWFWFGNQGWEYLDLGRGWQVLLVIGLVMWMVLIFPDSLRELRLRHRLHNESFYSGSPRRTRSQDDCNL